MWKNAIFSIFSAVRFLATVMLLNLALRKCWKYQCQFLNVSKTKKKVKKHFSYISRKKCITQYHFYVRTRFRMLDTGCSLYILKMALRPKSRFLFSKFKYYYFIFFFLKKVGNTAKISTCISERIVQFLKLLLYYPTRSNFLLGFLLLYLNEFRFFFLFFFFQWTAILFFSKD